MSAANLKTRLSKIEAVAAPSSVHVVKARAGEEESAIDSYGRKRIGPRDLVVVINRLA